MLVNSACGHLKLTHVLSVVVRLKYVSAYLRTPAPLCSAVFKTTSPDGDASARLARQLYGDRSVVVSACLPVKEKVGVRFPSITPIFCVDFTLLFGLDLSSKI